MAEKAVKKETGSKGQWLCGSVGRAVAPTPEVRSSNTVVGKF